METEVSHPAESDHVAIGHSQTRPQVVVAAVAGGHEGVEPIVAAGELDHHEDASAPVSPGRPAVQPVVDQQAPGPGPAHRGGGRHSTAHAQELSSGDHDAS